MTNRALHDLPLTSPTTPTHYHILLSLLVLKHPSNSIRRASALAFSSLCLECPPHPNHLTTSPLISLRASFKYHLLEKCFSNHSI